MIFAYTHVLLSVLIEVPLRSTRWSYTFNLINYKPNLIYLVKLSYLLCFVITIFNTAPASQQSWHWVFILWNVLSCVLCLLHPLNHSLHFHKDFPYLLKAKYHGFCNELLFIPHVLWIISSSSWSVHFLELDIMSIWDTECFYILFRYVKW